MPTQINGNTGIDKVQIGVVTPDDLNTMVNPSVQRIQTFTAQASTSGTSINFTDIPSWAKEITVMFDVVSLAGTTDYLIQLGDSGGIENTGYVSSATLVSAAASTNSSTSGFRITNTAGPAEAFSGNVVISNISGNNWVSSGTLARSGSINILVKG
jgi:hypothetical protein